jgi:hypothetical protein
VHTLHPKGVPPLVQPLARSGAAAALRLQGSSRLDTERRRRGEGPPVPSSPGRSRRGGVASPARCEGRKGRRVPGWPFRTPQRRRSVQRCGTRADGRPSIAPA